MFILGIFAGCGKTEDEQIKDTIEGYVKTYYSIDKDDYKFYEYITSGVKTDKQSDYIKIQKAEKLMKENTKKLKPYLTEKTYLDISTTLTSSGRIQIAYDKKVYVTAKGTNISKYTEDKEQNMVVYYVDIELIERPVNGGEEKTVKRTEQIKLFKEKGSYKVGWL